MWFKTIADIGTAAYQDVFGINLANFSFKILLNRSICEYITIKPQSGKEKSEKEIQKVYNDMATRNKDVIPDIKF